MTTNSPKPQNKTLKHWVTTDLIYMKTYTFTEKIDTRSGFGAGLTELGKLNENVVSCYMNGFSIPIMIGLCYATGGDLSAWRDFEGLEWFCIFALSVTVLMS